MIDTLNKIGFWVLTSNSATISPSLPMGKPLKFGIQTSSSSTMDGAEKAPLLMMLIDKSSMNTTCLRQVATILSKKFGPTSFFYLLRESVYYDCVLYGKGSPSKTGFLKLHKENLYSWVFKYLLLLSLSLSCLTHAIPCRLFGAWWARIKKVPASAFLLYFIFLWQKDDTCCDRSKTTHESLSTWRQEEGHSWNSRDVLCIPGTIKSQTHSIILDNRHMLNTCTAVQVNIWKWH